MDGNTAHSDSTWRTVSLPLDRPALPIERIGPASREQFFDEYAHRRPVIRTDMMRDWPATGRWTPEFFAEQVPDHRIEVYRHRANAGMSFLEQCLWCWTRARVADLVDTMRTGTPLLDADTGLALEGEPWEWASREDISLFKSYLHIAHDIRPEELLPKGSRRYQEALWMGPAGYITGLHCDFGPLNYILQFYGRKRAILFSPEQAHLLYPQYRHLESLYSLIDAFDPDLERHPLLRQALAAEAVIEPGEILYIPTGWWHLIQALEPSVTVTVYVIDA